MGPVLIRLVSLAVFGNHRPRPIMSIRASTIYLLYLLLEVMLCFCHNFIFVACCHQDSVKSFHLYPVILLTAIMHDFIDFVIT